MDQGKRPGRADKQAPTLADVRYLGGEVGRALSRLNFTDHDQAIAGDALLWAINALGALAEAQYQNNREVL